MILHSGVSPRLDAWRCSAGLGVRGSLSEALGGLHSGAAPGARLQVWKEGRSPRAGFLSHPLWVARDPR